MSRYRSRFRFKRREPSAWGYLRYVAYAALGGFCVAFLWATLLLGSWEEIGQPLKLCLTFSLPAGIVLMALQWLANGERNVVLERIGDAIAGAVFALLLGVVIAIVAGYAAGAYSPGITEKWGGAVQGEVTITDPAYAVDAMWWFGKGIIPVCGLLGLCFGAFKGRPGHVTDAIFQR